MLLCILALLNELSTIIELDLSTSTYKPVNLVKLLLLSFKLNWDTLGAFLDFWLECFAFWIWGEFLDFLIKLVKSESSLFGDLLPVFLERLFKLIIVMSDTLYWTIGVCCLKELGSGVWYRVWNEFSLLVFWLKPTLILLIVSLLLL